MLDVRAQGGICQKGFLALVAKVAENHPSRNIAKMTRFSPSGTSQSLVYEIIKSCNVEGIQNDRKGR